MYFENYNTKKMDKEITKLQPKEVWKDFYKLTQVARPSHHEEKARKMLLAWAKENNIDAKMDEAGNIIMSKPATKGMDNRKGVILQAHLDMVPQKNSDKIHDFENDPITAYIEENGEWVTADGTTLGADDGMGVAAGMAILTSTDIPHGPLELLVTATEETGMDGAVGLKTGLLKGEILLNLDSETEGELYIGCAGGVDTTSEFNYIKANVPANHIAYKIDVNGLKGGHSGMDIKLGRGNSNKLLFRFLKTYEKTLGLRLVSANGGSLRNAIPRESEAIITIPANKETELINAAKEMGTIFYNELKEKDEGVKVLVGKTEMPKFVMEEDLQNRIINAVLVCPNGFVRMVDSLPDTVETSNNMAIIECDDKKFVVKTLLRSSVETAKNALAQELQAGFTLAKADNLKLTGDYPGWEPNPKSAIKDLMIKIYKDLYDKEPAITAVHAGLECGILGSKYTNWDMVSFGPTLLHPHSPDEKVNIASVGRFYKLLTETLKNIPAK